MMLAPRPVPGSVATVGTLALDGQPTGAPGKRKRVVPLPPGTAPKDGKPATTKRVSKAGKKEKDGHNAVEDEDGIEGKPAMVASAAAGSNPETLEPSADQPVKRKRGRKKLIHDEEERKIRRKMQCKLNQRRYRARQRGMITNLSMDAEKTTDDIQELEGYHRFLARFDHEGTARAAAVAAAATATSSQRGGGNGGFIIDNRPAMVVEHFIHFFRHGFALHSVDIGDIQERFLRFAMDENVVSQGATRHGVDALILQLKRYTSYHTVFEIQVDSTEVINHGSYCGGGVLATPPSAVIHVSGRLHLRISRDTVMLLYPHIIEDEELNSKVVGHEIYPTFSMVFHFNERSKVAKFEFSVDLVVAFMQLLGDAASTSRLLKNAIITPLCELGVDPHGALDAKPKGSKQLSLKFILL